MKLGKILHKVVLLRPLLKLFGVKDKTVAAKIGEGLFIVDRAVNEPKDKGVVIIELLLFCILVAPIVWAIFG